jgi:hypothetical protein
MRRLEGRLLPAVLLLALGLALASVALGPEFDPPGHYDGDGDDAGLIWKTLSQGADIPAIGSELRFASSPPVECPPPGEPLAPQHVVRDSLGSRAPPA